MKKLFQSLCIIFISVFVTSCYDDTALRDLLAEQGGRLDYLETLCGELNVNIGSLQTLIRAIQDADYITSVAPVVEGGTEVGYTITFAKFGTVTIMNGTVGAGNEAIPVIGAKQDENGTYCWTMNGEWLVGDSGEKIPASAKDGVTPQIKITDGNWYVSYDNGKNWNELGEAEGKDFIFSDVIVKEDSVRFVLADGTVFLVPLKSEIQKPELDIIFSVEQGTPIHPNASLAVGYTVVGGDDKTLVRSLSVSDDVWASIERTSPTTGTIYIYCSEAYDDSQLAILVSVSDGNNDSILKSLNLSAGVISMVQDTYMVPALEGTFTAIVETNMDYIVRIPEEATWLSLAPDTKAEIRYDKIAFAVETNDGMSRRTANVELVGESGVVLENFSVVQNYMCASAEFDDEIVKQACIAAFDTDFDGIFTYEEAARVTDLGLMRMPLEATSFDELKYFTSLTNIPSDFFADCVNLRTVELPAISKIGDNAFYNTGLTEIDIPVSVKSIGRSAFADCDSLKEVHFLSPDPSLEFNESIFDWNTLIYVPEGCYPEYVEQLGYNYNWARTLWEWYDITELHVYVGNFSVGTMTFVDGLWVWEGNVWTGGKEYEIRFGFNKDSSLYWPCFMPNADGTGVFYVEESYDYQNVYRISTDGYYRITVNPDCGAMNVEYAADDNLGNLPFTSVVPIYYGDLFRCQTGNYVIKFTTDELAKDNRAAGVMLTMNMFGKLLRKAEGEVPEIVLPSGTYTVCPSFDSEEFSMLYGVDMDIYGEPFGTYLLQQDVSGTRSMEYLSEGTVEVSSSGEGEVRVYTLQYEFKTAKKRTVKGTWIGPLHFTDISEELRPSLLSTLDGPVECDLYRVEKGYLTHIETLKTASSDNPIDIADVWQVWLEPRLWNAEEKKLDWEERIQKWNPNGDVMLFEFVTPPGNNGNIAPEIDKEYVYQIQPDLSMEDDLYQYLHSVSKFTRPHDDIFYEPLWTDYTYMTGCDTRRGFFWDGGFRGVWYMHYIEGTWQNLDEQAPAVSGTIKVTRTSDIKYVPGGLDEHQMPALGGLKADFKLVWELYDDAVPANKISGEWSGPLTAVTTVEY